MSKTNTKRQPAGIPTGGQFAMSGKDESNVALSDLATPTTDAPGPNQKVVCPRCEGRSDAKDMAACYYCTDGKVTTDRYGQFPWKPAVPGTQVAFEVMQGDDRKWQAATITASEWTERLRSDKPSNYALAYLVGVSGASTREVSLRRLLPVPAAQAAARHRVSTHEMIAEAADEMALPDLNPTHDEVTAFLARIDDDYLDEIAASAREFRRNRGAQLRAEGRTGPALDRSFDVSTLPSGALERSIAQTKQHLQTMTEITARDHWHGHTLVAKTSAGGHARIETYADTAWERPDETPMLPWSRPTGQPVAHVGLDGIVTRVDAPDSTIDL